jgi:protein gp37
MGKNSSIEWCHHTLNGVRGCTKKLVALVENDVEQGFHPSGCDACYAEVMSHRNPAVLGVWGLFGTRQPASETTWKAVLQWDKDAKEAGERHRVFAYSLGDVGEMPMRELDAFIQLHGIVPTSEHIATVQRNQRVCDNSRARLFDLVEQCQSLDFLLLTKRPEYMGDIVPKHWHTSPPANWWQGTSISTKRDAEERLPLLGRLPARVRFVSFEPLLENIEFELDSENTTDPLGLLSCPKCKGYGAGEVASPVGGDPIDRACGWCQGSGSLLDWAIIGGESGGPKARDCEYEAIRSMSKQLELADVFRFIKQVGRNPVEIVDGKKHRLKLVDKKGGDMDEWPKDLRVQEFPEARGFNASVLVKRSHLRESV